MLIQIDDDQYDYVLYNQTWLKFVFKLRTKTLSLFHELVKEIEKC